MNAFALAPKPGSSESRLLLPGKRAHHCLPLSSRVGVLTRVTGCCFSLRCSCTATAGLGLGGAGGLAAAGGCDGVGTDAWDGWLADAAGVEARRAGAGATGGGVAGFAGAAGGVVGGVGAGAAAEPAGRRRCWRSNILLTSFRLFSPAIASAVRPGYMAAIFDKVCPARTTWTDGRSGCLVSCTFGWLCSTKYGATKVTSEENADGASMPIFSGLSAIAAW